MTSDTRKSYGWPVARAILILCRPSCRLQNETLPSGTRGRDAALERRWSVVNLVHLLMGERSAWQRGISTQTCPGRSAPGDFHLTSSTGSTPAEDPGCRRGLYIRLALTAFLPQLAENHWNHKAARHEQGY
jgi:hypothetical protein